MKKTLLYFYFIKNVKKTKKTPLENFLHSSFFSKKILLLLCILTVGSYLQTASGNCSDTLTEIYGIPTGHAWHESTAGTATSNYAYGQFISYGTIGSRVNRGLAQGGITPSFPNSANEALASFNNINQDSVKWTNVNGGSGGQATFTYYNRLDGSGDNGNLTIFVNGVLVQTITGAPQGAATSVTVTLKAGQTNTVVLRATNSGSAPAGFRLVIPDCEETGDGDPGGECTAPASSTRFNISNGAILGAWNHNGGAVTNTPENNGNALTGQIIGFTSDLDLNYNINVTQAGTYSITIRYACDNPPPGMPIVYINGINVGAFTGMASTGGWGNFQTATITGVELLPGEHIMRVDFDGSTNRACCTSYDAFIFTLTDPCIPTSSLSRPEVTATPTDCDQINLSWNAVEGADRYRIYTVSSASGMDTTFLAQQTGTTYQHTGLSASTTYYYRVLAIGEGGKALSDVASATTTVGTNPRPTISAAVPDYTAITLTLSPIPTALSNTLYRSTSPTSRGSVVAGYNGTATTFTDTGLSEGVTYYYTLVSTFATSCPREHTNSAKTLSNIAYPTPLNCTYSNCPQDLVGYINFANRNGIETGRWSINDIDFYGLANESLTTTGSYQSSGDLVTSGNYFIVKNPSSVRGGNSSANAEQLQNIPDALGGVFLIRGGNDNSLIYTITGLSTGTDARATYCIRIKMRNVGRASQNDSNDRDNACQENGNNIRVCLRNLAGNNKNNNTSPYGNRYGSYSTVNTGNCTTNVTANWTENQQQNTMTRYGDLTIFEGAITTGTDGGFQIQIRGIGDARNNITGIESIEVYGCLPREIVAEDQDGNSTVVFCENSPFTLTASGAGFGDINEVRWYRGATEVEALAAAVAETSPVGRGTAFFG